MKKLVSLLLCTIMVVSIVSGCSSENKKVLKIYNAGEYIEKSLLSDFESENDCKIVYETFDSNESMYTKIMSGEQYDILIPSDYMIERLIKEEYLQPIQWNLISNKKNMITTLQSSQFDKGNKYSVPYFWGTVGIIYDSKKVNAADVTGGWNLLCNSKYKDNIYMYDSERDSFMVALKALGFSMNTTNKKELEQAYQWLVNQRNTMSPVYVGDDVIDNMIAGNKAMAVVYSGDAAYMMSENPDLKFMTPEQGTNRWTDCMVLTKNCKDSALAHKFMNFMLDADNALANSEAVGYSSPVQSAFDKMKTTTYAGIEAYVPRVGFAKDEAFNYQRADIKKYIADLWTKVKAY